MSNYKITKYSKDKAKKENVIIKPSTNKNKKIDVFNKSGVKIASIGGIKKDGTPYNDYPTYLKTIGKEKADIRRKLYIARHSKEVKIKNGKKTNSYYSDVILW